MVAGFACDAGFVALALLPRAGAGCAAGAVWRADFFAAVPREDCFAPASRDAPLAGDFFRPLSFERDLRGAALFDGDDADAWRRESSRYGSSGSDLGKTEWSVAV